ncbi:MAG: hypothetical protein HOZ81_50470 [Streptomyces sp.]|nr:hypothetical protein [Streptomyces sp.]NUS24400.1 hypothetical protein [Streptomyces sp.]
MTHQHDPHASADHLPLADQMKLRLALSRLREWREVDHTKLSPATAILLADALSNAVDDLADIILRPPTS